MLLLGAVLVVLAAVFARKHVAVTILILFASLRLVRGFAQDSTAADTPWASILRNEERVSLTGVLLSDPSPTKDRARLCLEIEPVDDVGGEYFVDVYTERLHDRSGESRRSNDFRHGDRYRISGRFNLVTGREISSAWFLLQVSISLVLVKATDCGRRWQIFGRIFRISWSIRWDQKPEDYRRHCWWAIAQSFCLRRSQISALPVSLTY